MRVRVLFAFLPILIVSFSVNGQTQTQSVEPVKEIITVTAARVELPLAETSGSVIVVDRDRIERTPSRTIDDQLRQIPGFSLLRRSSSLVANPTSQGVSLRGLGTNGASRTLVLLDGDPLNDPFGGWVYWRRVPKTIIDRIEVVEGSRSDLYGSAALSGVIQILTLRPSSRTFVVDADLGNEDTRSISMFGSQKWKQFGVSASGDLFSTDGYHIVPREQRGPVDLPARSRNGSLDLRVSFDPIPDLQTSLRASAFSEDRDNGTLLQVNHTEIRSFSFSARLKTGDGSDFYGNVRGGFQTFTSTFSAISVDRRIENLSRSQRVPSDFIGFSLQWSRRFAERHNLLAGVDWQKVVGATNELIFQGALITPSVNGGRQNTLGIFFQDIIAARPNLRFTIGAQLSNVRDRERLKDGSRLESVFNPKFGALYRPKDWLAIRGAFYRAFRSPTLNELYRPFRLGNVLTLANANLKAEILTGGEAGADIAPSRSLRISMTAFGAELSGPVANVTLSFRPDLITRQRQNLGAVRSNGFEARIEHSIRDRLLLNAGYIYTRSRVGSFSANAALVGNSVPQTPRNQASFSAAVLSDRLGSIILQSRASSAQFEDDQNRLRLPGFLLFDLGYRRSIGKHIDAFVNVENLFNRRVIVGKGTIDSIGGPRLVSVGMRLKIGKL